MDHADKVLNQLDLGHVTQRLQDRGGFEQDVALMATDLYKKFLYLKMKYPQETLVSPRLVDEAWHEHILSTEAYAKDCDKLCGYFIHHNPNPDAEKHATGWQKTRELFVSEFGIDLTKGTNEGLKVAGNSY